jgi:hypothetical protein
MSADTKLLSIQAWALPQWWTVQDVAEYRQVSVTTVYSLVSKAKRLKQRGLPGGIPFSPPSMRGHIRFSPEAVRDYFGDTDSEDAKVAPPIKQPAQIVIRTNEHPAEFIATLKELEKCMNTIVDTLQQARGRIQLLIGRSGGKTQ